MLSLGYAAEVAAPQAARAQPGRKPLGELVHWGALWAARA